MQPITTHPVRWLVVVLALATLSLGIVATSSHANSVPTCSLAEDVIATSPSEAGGQLISFVTSCTGHGSVTESVTVEQGTRILFKTGVSKTVSGSLYDVTEIHLPPIPLIEQICVTAASQKVCVPPSL